ncbi:MAG: response regulator [Planctomycetota bacterium]|jgi:DNA-binding response OmpR family regulator
MKRILIVEDEVDVSRYLAAALEDAGFEVICAPDADRGLRLATLRRPDLVCLDIVMPGRTGLSLYQELREASDLPALPVIVVSGVSPADAERRLGLGGRLPPPDSFVEKPVDLSRFLAEVRRLLAA